MFVIELLFLGEFNDLFAKLLKQFLNGFLSWDKL